MMRVLLKRIRMLFRRQHPQCYLLTSTCRGFEWSGLGKYSPYPKKYGVSEHHADGNRYRCMGLAFTRWLDMAVTALRAPVPGLPSLFRGHSCQLSFKQIPVALSRSYGGGRSTCASCRGWLGSESHLVCSELWSAIHAFNAKRPLTTALGSRTQVFQQGSRA